MPISTAQSVMNTGDSADGYPGVYSRMKRGAYSVRVAALFMAWFAGTTTVQAATQTVQFSVTSTVTSSCSAPTATPLSFGTYNPLSGTALTATSTITITCTNTTPIVSVTLNSGSGNGTINARKLQLGGTTTSDATRMLSYNLYTTSGYSSIWGDGSSGNVTNNVTGSAGTGSAQTLTVYGTLPGSQTNVVPGSYSDTITVTINY